MSLKAIKNSLLARASINSYISDFDDESKTSLGAADSQSKGRSIFAGLVRHCDQNGDSPTLFQSAEKRTDEADISEFLTDATRNKINRINRLFLELKSAGLENNKAIRYRRKIDIAIDSLKLVKRNDERRNLEAGKYVSERYFSSSMLNNFSSRGDKCFLNCYNNVEIIKKNNSSLLTSEMFWKTDLTEDFLCALNCGSGKLKETILCATIDGGLKIWDQQGISKPIRIYQGKRKFYDCFSSILNCDFTIHAGNYKGNIKTFDLRMKDSFGLLVTPRDKNETQEFCPITSLDKSNEHTLLSTQKNFFSVWDLRIPKEIIRIPHESSQNSELENETLCIKASFLEGGNQALVLNRDEKNLLIWDLNTRKKRKCLEFDEIVNDFNTNPETEELLVLTQDATTNETPCSKLFFFERKKNMKIVNYDSVEFLRHFTRLSTNEHTTFLFDGEFINTYSHSKVEETELVRNELREHLKV